jgi:hypothetical protein
MKYILSYKNKPETVTQVEQQQAASAYACIEHAAAYAGAGYVQF